MFGKCPLFQALIPSGSETIHESTGLPSCFVNVKGESDLEIRCCLIIQNLMSLYEYDYTDDDQIRTPKTILYIV